jgi:hypothetical protein
MQRSLFAREVRSFDWSWRTPFEAGTQHSYRDIGAGRQHRWRTGGLAGGFLVDSLAAGQVIGQLRLQVLMCTRSLHDLADGIHHQRRPVPMNVVTAAVDDNELGVR